MAKNDDNKGASKKPAKGGKGGQGKGGKKGGKGKKKKDSGPAPTYKRETPPRLKTKYHDEIAAKLKEEFKYSSAMEIPRVVKVTLNMGLGRANQEPKVMENAVEELAAIAGQAPVVCLAKRDIATFKLRKGQKIGAMVTLRRERMWEFLDRFINVALPRVRDFRGISGKAFDGRGNYSCGIKEQIIFPEIDYDAIDSVKGLNVSIVTTAKTDAEGRALLKHLGMPFRQPSTPAQGAQA
jgi:large subunit ribosomal protein L5